MKKILTAHENIWLFSVSERVQVQVTNMNVKYQPMEIWLPSTALLTNSANYVGRKINKMSSQIQLKDMGTRNYSYLMVTESGRCGTRD